MNGQREIGQLRRSGSKPVAVFLLDYPEKKPWPVADQLARGVVPGLHIDRDDPAACDLRFLIGIRVHLACDNESRAATWVDRLHAAGVKHIIHSTRDGEIDQWRE